MVGTKKGRSGVEWMVFTDLAGTHRVRAPLEMPPCTSPPHRPFPVLSYCRTLCTCHDESRCSGFGKWVHLDESIGQERKKVKQALIATLGRREIWRPVVFCSTSPSSCGKRSDV